MVIQLFFVLWSPVLFFVLWSPVSLSVDSVSFYSNLLPVIVGRGVELAVRSVVLTLCLLSTGSAFPSGYALSFHPRDPIVTAPASWVDWRSTSWCPDRNSQSIPLTFDLRATPLPGECVASQFGAAQDYLPLLQQFFLLLIWLVLLFISLIHLLSAVPFLRDFSTILTCS